MSCPSPQRYTPASAGRSVLCTPSGSDTTTICWVPSPASSTSRWTGVTTTSCSQFVAGLLRDSGALELSKPPALVRPADFCQIHQLRTVHQGDMGGLPALALA